MISRSTIQKVNDTADILDVVGSFVKLKKRGANYLGNCPFHNEKTPSFTVSASKGIYKCFGCGKAGNVITFVQEHEKLTYPESIVWLAKRYHIEVEETAVSNEVKEQQQKLGNPGPLEKVCFNCTNMMWMVGIGQGVKCRLTMKDIPSRLYTCDQFIYK